MTTENEFERGCVKETASFERGRNLQRATATAATTTRPERESAKPAFQPPHGRRKRIRESLRSTLTSSSSRNRVQTAPCAANRPAWPRRTGAAAAARRRPRNENQASRGRRTTTTSGLGSNRGLFCQCSLVHEVGKSWQCERRRKTKEEKKTFGRRRGRGLRCGSDTAAGPNTQFFCDFFFCRKISKVNL